MHKRALLAIAHTIPGISPHKAVTAIVSNESKYKGKATSPAKYEHIQLIKMLAMVKMTVNILRLIRFIIFFPIKIAALKVLLFQSNHADRE